MKYIIKDNKIKRIDISGIIIKGLIDQNSINKEKRIFSGFGSVAVIDRQGDYLPIEEFKPVMEKLMQRGAPVTDSHSNHVVGKIVDYTYKPTPTGEMGLYLTAEIYNHYPTDAETWRKIQDGEYTGFSLGGKAGTKTPTCTNIGCYNILGNIEAWEFSIVERPANQLANIDKFNKLAKASDVIEEVVYSIMKERVYIKTPADAPKGVKLQTGKYGGKYYESETQTSNINLLLRNSESQINNILQNYDKFSQNKMNDEEKVIFAQKLLNLYNKNKKYIEHLNIKPTELEDALKLLLSEDIKDKSIGIDSFLGLVHYNNTLLLELVHRSQPFTQLSDEELDEEINWEKQIGRKILNKLNEIRNRKGLETRILRKFDKFTLEDAKRIGDKLNIDWTKIDQHEFHIGLNIELEHQDVTEGDEILTGKIALAHLNEFPDYYNKERGLPKMEDKLKKGIITKTKIYVEDPSSAPKGVKLEHGKRGGTFYESRNLPTPSDGQEENIQPSDNIDLPKLDLSSPKKLKLESSDNIKDISSTIKNRKDEYTFLKNGGWNPDKSKLFDWDNIDPNQDNIHMKDNQIYAMSRTSVYNGNILQLEYIESNPDMRGKGYGKKAMRDIVQSALKNNIEVIFLYSQANEFYDVIGMKKVRDMPEMNHSEYRGGKEWMKRFLEDNLEKAMDMDIIGLLNIQKPYIITSKGEVQKEYQQIADEYEL